MSDLNKKTIVCIGGGTGLFSLLSGLKEYSDTYDIKAIVSTLDNGGSSGKLITQYGVLPPGDIRNCLVALSDETKVMNELFQYRFDKQLDDHNVGNLLLTALTKIMGSFDEAVKELSRILRIKGEVIPVSLDHNTLIAHCTDGSTIRGESQITKAQKKVQILELEHPEKANPRALDVLKHADVIIFGPGSLYTSIIANLLFDSVSKTINANKKAKKIVVTSVMSQPGETDDFEVSQHKNEVERYLKGSVTHVLANNHIPDESILTKYRKENKHPTLIDEKNIQGCTLIKKDLIDLNTIVRHDPKKLSKAILNLSI